MLESRLPAHEREQPHKPISAVANICAMATRPIESVNLRARLAGSRIFPAARTNGEGLRCASARSVLDLGGPLCQRSCRPNRIGPLGADIRKARYGQAYKDRIVARLLQPESSSAEQVSREVRVSAATLERWRADALAPGSGDRTGGSQRWTAAARLQALIATAGMDEATRSGWCREQGPYRLSWQPGSRTRSRVSASRVRSVLWKPDRTGVGSSAWKLSAVFNKDADE